MAVVDAVPGVTVEIVVNGEALREYTCDEDRDEGKGTPQSTCYVEAQSGAFFEVRSHVKKGTRCLGDRVAFDVSIDGRYIDNMGFWSSACKTKDVTSCHLGRELSDGMVQRFCFADLKTSDDATSDNQPSLAEIKELGIIKVQMHHRQSINGVGKSAVWRAIAPAAFPTVPEKVLKGQSISHNVELKSVQSGPSGPRGRVRATYVDPSRKPAATYIFRYRSRASLQSMLLIPRTPSPEPAQEHKVDGMPRDKLLEPVTQAGLHEDQANADADTQKIKRERIETSPSRRKVRRNNQVTTIELDENGNIVRETVQPRSATPDPSDTIVLD